MEGKTLAIKVDVDTLKAAWRASRAPYSGGGTTGFLLFSWARSYGQGRPPRFPQGFIGKMLRTDAPGTYGLKTMLYGTLLPAPLIYRRTRGSSAVSCRRV